MQKIEEGSFNQLYRSAVTAFPRTTKRQHATDTIRIIEINWTPFIGLNTLLVRGLAQNEGKEYNPVILFKKVKYHEQQLAGLVRLRANTDQEYLLERISSEENDVLLRCNCPDFYWRFNYYNHLDHSLYGRKRPPYITDSSVANPLELPGACKHLMKLGIALKDSGILV